MPPNEVQVYCLNCPEQNTVFTHPISGAGATVDFPADFPNAGPGEPRYNGTWEVRVVRSSPGSPPVVYAQSTFETWLTNGNTTTPEATFQVLDTIRVRASGFATGSAVTAKLVQLLPSGEEVARYTAGGTARGSGGVVSVAFPLPLDFASHLHCSGSTPDPSCQRFRLDVTSSGTTKTPESVNLRIVPATLEPVVLRYPPTLQRTENATALVNLRYQTGAPLVPSYLSGDIADQTLTMQLQRVDPTGSPGNNKTLATVHATWSSALTARGFIPRWLIPKDLDLGSQGQYRFRWVLPAQRDRWGNQLPFTPLATFNITPYQIVPKVVDQPRSLERTLDGVVSLRLTYADGEPVTNQDNASKLSGVLQRVENGTGAQVTSPRYRLNAGYVGDGVWTFHHRFPKAYPNLGTWTFQFQGTPQGTQAQDRWGNTIQPASADPFQLTVAHPRVSLTTVADGEDRNATRGFDRGDHVTFVVRTTYPDGSPLNASDLRYPDYEDGLVLRLHERTADGAEAGTVDLLLRQLNPAAGTWTGSFHVPLDRADAPIGTWSLEIPVVDNVTGSPNANDSRFARAVHAGTLRISTLAQPRFDRFPVGSPVSWSFQVVDPNGRILGDKDLGANVHVNVVEETRNGTRTYVSGLYPDWDAKRHLWTVTWSPSRTVDQATFRFTAVGSDLDGNLVAPGSYSRAFTYYAPVETRDVIIQPPLQVRRGEDAVAVFDGHPGDAGLQGAAQPSIQLQRWVADRSTWVVEIPDVLNTTVSTGLDHVAVWSTTVDTPRGTYRFAMVGRGADGAQIQGTTRSFEVVPRNVTRAVVQDPVPFITKGATVHAVLARSPGDRITHVDVVGPGGTTTTIPVWKAVDAQRTTVNLTWTVPFDTPQGAYVLEVSGTDVHGNAITARVGPITVGSVNLTVESLVEPDPRVPRTQPAELLFRVHYPDRTLVRPDQGTPVVWILHDGDALARVNVTFDGVNWHARWTSDPSTPLGTYRFEVTGVDAGGNRIPTTRSRTFALDQGVVDRNVTTEPPQQVARLTTLSTEVPADSQDRFVAFELLLVQNPGSSGPLRTQNVGTVSHTYDAAKGVYRTDWQVPKDLPRGTYLLRMTGQDGFGNDLQTDTRTFTVVGTHLEAHLLDHITTFPTGQTATYRLRVTYPDGTPLTPVDGTPSVRVELNGQPVVPRPTVSYDDATKLWTISWAFPQVMPPGQYHLVVDGSDGHGNQILPTQGPGRTYHPSTVNQLTGATIPGPGAGALVAALAALALVLPRFRGRSPPREVPRLRHRER